MGSVIEWFVKGGSVMYLILFFSFLGLAIILERGFFILFRYSINAPVFMEQIFKLISSNNIEKAIKLCEAFPYASLAIVTKAALLNYGKSEKEIQNAVDETVLKVLPIIQKRTGYLSMVANVATLLGLLGTIFGLQYAFDAVANAPASQKQFLLANGIAIALNTTAFGLIVAIPCIICYTYLQNRVTKLVDEIDEYSVKLINWLVSNSNKEILEGKEK